jgi:putative transposase
MESFFGTVKTQLTHHQAFLTSAQARADIFYYIEAFNNRRRRHSALGYQSPEQIEQSCYCSKN